MAETRKGKGKTGLEWLLREADSKPASAEILPAAPGSVPVASAPEPWAKSEAPAPVVPADAPVMRPSRVSAEEKKNGNRRATHRVKTAFEVRYKKGSEQITAVGANLSLGGFYFETKKFLPLGDVFQAQLVFPAHANRRMAVIAEVIHQEDGGLGAKFLDVDDKDKSFIEEVITKSATG